MSFATLNQPSVFLASSGDLGKLRQRFQPFFDLMLQESATRRELNTYIWEESVSDSGFDHWRAAQVQIPLPFQRELAPQ